MALVRLGSVVGAPRTWAAPGRDALEPHAERIRSWVQHDELQLTRVQELLAQDGVRCSYMTLLRFVRRGGWSGRPRSTVRVAESQPGDVAEIDYGRMGMLLNPLTGNRQAIWALVVVLPFSRHCFVTSGPSPASKAACARSAPTRPDGGRDRRLVDGAGPGRELDNGAGTPGLLSRRENWLSRNSGEVMMAASRRAPTRRPLRQRLRCVA